ncbi:MAG: exopolyphosphatase [Desulfobacteraceae bacterium]|nr:MAG: exopolyphosphatase [Desulfobacteraceae bacterium]
MKQPFPKSASLTVKCKELHRIVLPEDSLCILITADPDAMASALALKRLFWRKVRRIKIFHINSINRADNRAFIRLLNIKQQHIRKLKRSEFTKWALLDSQPQHNDLFKSFNFDLIIDHHPWLNGVKAAYLDIRAGYGANSTILTEYLRTEKIRPSPRLATALFYGIKTDTNNFVRASSPNDVNAFQYLYRFANTNIITKIESSEMTKETLVQYAEAMQNMTIIKHTAFIHMGTIENSDSLVMIADFFLKLAEIDWCVTSGILNGDLIVVFRSAGLRRDAGKTAEKSFGAFGPAGGRRNAARAEMPVENIRSMLKSPGDYRSFVIDRVRRNVIPSGSRIMK